MGRWTDGTSVLFLCKGELLMDHSDRLALVRDIIDQVGDDSKREGLIETPKRFFAAFQHWTFGYSIDPASVFKTFEDGSEGYDQLVFQGAIPVWSLCEHHMAPFFGIAHVAYIPKDRIVGLSKIIRLVDVFARRLQVQERLTRQIADCIQEHLAPRGVGVVLRCRHTCIESRGVQKAGSMTYTSALLGAIKEEAEARTEFMELVQRADAQATI